MKKLIISFVFLIIIIFIAGCASTENTPTTDIPKEMNVVTAEPPTPAPLSAGLTVTPTRTPTATPTTNPEIEEYFVAFGLALELHNKAFSEYSDYFLFSLPYDYTIASYRERANNDVKIELRKVTALSEEVSNVYTGVFDADVPDEYALSKAKLLSGIKEYQNGVIYLKQCYDMYLNEGTYSAINKYFTDAEFAFLNGDDKFIEAYDLLPE